MTSPKAHSTVTTSRMEKSKDPVCLETVVLFFFFSLFSMTPIFTRTG